MMTGRVLLPGLALLGCLLGCDEEVNPFIEEDRYFTLYGYLDTAADTQFVRVIALRRSLVEEPFGPLDARVTLVPLPDGPSVTLRDSLVQFADGRYGHVFYAPLRVFPGWTYRLDVERADGARATAETTVPVAPGATIGTPSFFAGGFTQSVQWTRIDTAPYRLEVWYRFQGEAPHQPFREASVAYGEEHLGRLRNDLWEVEVRLSEDRDEVARQLGGVAFPLLGVGMRLTMPDDAWRPPTGVFDPDLLVQPGVFTNVTGGFGFLGAVNQYTVEWVLDATTVRALGYGVPGQTAP
jgi:hypothetical protein